MRSFNSKFLRKKYRLGKNEIKTNDHEIDRLVSILYPKMIFFVNLIKTKGPQRTLKAAEVREDFRGYLHCMLLKNACVLVLNEKGEAVYTWTYAHLKERENILRRFNLEYLNEKNIIQLKHKLDAVGTEEEFIDICFIVNMLAAMKAHNVETFHLKKLSIQLMIKLDALLKALEALTEAGILTLTSISNNVNTYEYSFAFKDTCTEAETAIGSDAEENTKDISKEEEKDVPISHQTKWNRVFISDETLEEAFRFLNFKFDDRNNMKACTNVTIERDMKLISYVNIFYDDLTEKPMNFVTWINQSIGKKIDKRPTSYNIYAMKYFLMHYTSVSSQRKESNREHSKEKQVEFFFNKERKTVFFNEICSPDASVDIAEIQEMCHKLTGKEYPEYVVLDLLYLWNLICRKGILGTKNQYGYIKQMFPSIFGHTEIDGYYPSVCDEYITSLLNELVELNILRYKRTKYTVQYASVQEFLHHGSHDKEILIHKEETPVDVSVEKSVETPVDVSIETEDILSGACENITKPENVSININIKTNEAEVKAYKEMIAAKEEMIVSLNEKIRSMVLNETESIPKDVVKGVIKNRFSMLMASILDNFIKVYGAAEKENYSEVLSEAKDAIIKDIMTLEDEMLANLKISN